MQEGFTIRCALTDGSGWQTISTCKTAQEWLSAQQRLYQTSLSYSYGGGARFQKMINMNFEEMKRAEQAANVESIQTRPDINPSLKDGGLAHGLALVAKNL